MKTKALPKTTKPLDTKELLTKIYEMVKADPAILTMVEMRSLAISLGKALEEFCAKAEVAQWMKRRDYVRLVGVLQNKRPKPKELQTACNKLKLTIPMGKDKVAKLTLDACRSGKAAALADALERSPDDKLREKFRDVAKFPTQQQREAELKELLKGKKLEEYAKAVGFQIVMKSSKAGKHTTDRIKTFTKALEKLEGYAEDLAGVR